MASNEIPKKDVRRRLVFKGNCDIESKTSKCTAIKQTDESFESDCEVSKLDGTLDTLNNSFLRSGEIKMIEEKNNSLVSDCSNIITSTPLWLEEDICTQQTFTHSPLAVDFKYNKSHVDGDYSPMKSIMLPNEAELIDAVTPMKLPGSIVPCSTPEAHAKFLGIPKTYSL